VIWCEQGESLGSLLKKAAAERRRRPTPLRRRAVPHEGAALHPTLASPTLQSLFQPISQGVLPMMTTSIRRIDPLVSK